MHISAASENNWIIKEYYSVSFILLNNHMFIWTVFLTFGQVNWSPATELLEKLEEFI